MSMTGAGIVLLGWLVATAGGIFRQVRYLDLFGWKVRRHFDQSDSIFWQRQNVRSLWEGSGAQQRFKVEAVGYFNNLVELVCHTVKAQRLGGCQNGQAVGLMLPELVIGQ